MTLPDIRLGPRCPGTGHQPATGPATNDDDVAGHEPATTGAGGRPPGATTRATRPATGGGHAGLAVIPDGVAAGLPSTELAGNQMTARARAWLALRHWAVQWRAGVMKAAGKPGGIYHAQPESLAMHDAYRKSRAWVPDGHDGKLIGPAGDIYHRTAASFGLVTGYWWAWTFARPLRLMLTLAAVGGVLLGFWLG